MDQRETEIERLRVRADRAADTRIDRAADDIGHLLARARALSPSATLERGYSIVQSATGGLVSSIADTQRGDHLVVRVRDGRIDTETKGTRAAPSGIGGSRHQTRAGDTADGLPTRQAKINKDLDIGEDQ